MPRLSLSAVVLAGLLVGCSARPGAIPGDPYLVARVYASDPTTAYRVAYDEAREQGWGILERDRLRYGGREFLAVTPGAGTAFEAQVSVAVAGVEEGVRVLIRSRIDAPPDDREVPRFLDSLAVHLGPPLPY